MATTALPQHAAIILGAAMYRGVNRHRDGPRDASLREIPEMMIMPGTDEEILARPEEPQASHHPGDPSPAPDQFENYDPFPWGLHRYDP